MLWYLLGLILGILFYLICHKPRSPNYKGFKMRQHVFITLSKKHTHITPILKSLHWLQVRDRIILKILLMTFHCVQGTAPQYYIDLVHNYTPVRSLRSSNSGSLIIPKFATTWGTRAFAHAGPTLWNNLPSVIKHCSSSDSFKSGLKTHLFNASFWLLMPLYFILSYFLITFSSVCA